MAKQKKPATPQLPGAAVPGLEGATQPLGWVPISRSQKKRLALQGVTLEPEPEPEPEIQAKGDK